MALQVNANLEHVTHNGVSNWWLNLLRHSSDWVWQKKTSPFTFNVVPVHSPDANGQLVQLDSDQRVYRYLQGNAHGVPNYNSVGNYLVLYYTGVGTFTMAGGATYSLISNDTGVSPKRAVISVAWGSSSPFFEVLTVDAGDPIQLVAMVPEVYEADYLAGVVYHPEFLASIEPFEKLRFLNPALVNDSTLVNWSDRRQTTQLSWHSQGSWDNSAAEFPVLMTPFEEIVNLCNETQKHLFLPVPHQMSDAACTSLFTMVRDNLDANLTATFEYSNEVWNSIFDQYDYAVTQGLTYWPASSAHERNWRFYALRAGQVADLARAVFTGGHAARLTFGASWQSVGSFIGNLVLTYTDATITTALKDKVDCVFIAPYFSGGLGSDPQAVSGPPESPHVKTTVEMTAAEVVAGAQTDFADLVDAIQDWRAIIDPMGLPLYFYEFGPHLIASTALQNNTTLTGILIDGSVHADMEAACVTYMETLAAELDDGADAYWYRLTGPNDKYSTFGLLQDQGSLTTPKWLAVTGYIEDNAVTGIGVTRRRRGLIASTAARSK